jgi:CxxC-x17-CxxC domain-containing protein
MRWGETEDHSDKIIKVSRERYGQKRKEVEEKIERWSSQLFEAEEEGPKDKYLTRCWACGKETTVGFKPDDVRPVYCHDCLKKVETGEIAPVPSRRPIRAGRARESYGETLSSLGIEFSEGLEKAGEHRETPVPRMGPRRPHFPREGDFVLRKEKSSKPISLEALKSRTHPYPERHKRGPDLEGLREVLKEAVGNKDAENPKDS